MRDPVLAPAGHGQRTLALTFADGGSEGLVSKTRIACLSGPLRAMHTAQHTYVTPCCFVAQKVVNTAPANANEALVLQQTCPARIRPCNHQPLTPCPLTAGVHPFSRSARHEALPSSVLKSWLAWQMALYLAAMTVCLRTFATHMHAPGAITPVRAGPCRSYWQLMDTRLRHT